MMGIWDYVILSLVVIWLVAAVVWLIRHRGHSGCCGTGSCDGAGCSCANCSHASQCRNKPKAKRKLLSSDTKGKKNGYIRQKNDEQKKGWAHAA